MVERHQVDMLHNIIEVRSQLVYAFYYYIGL